MGRSHAKNNTTQSTLTYYERSLLRQDGAARRLGVDSMKPLDACNLCLSRAVSAVACAAGHLYCRECVLGNLLAQKAGIEAQRREVERWAAEDEARRREAREKARERVVGDFERGMGLGAARAGSVAGAGGALGEATSATSAASTTSTTAGSSGGRPALADEIERVAREAEDRASRTIEAELAAGRKSKLAAFWLPSNAPEAPLGPVKDVKLQTLCHVGGRAHPLSRKTLVPVIFTYPAQSTKPACPSCTRELSNASTPILLTSRTPAVDPAAAAAAPAGAAADAPAERPRKKAKKDKEAAPVCGHVVCKTCADTVVAPAARCCVCEAEVGPADMVKLGKEEVKKAVTTFRV